MSQATASSAERRHHSKPPSLALDILALQHIVGNHAVNYLLQRSQYSPALVNDVPSIVHEVLSSSGQPLDAQTCAFMESGFDHDFSQVRVHTDEQAAKSAEEVHARAYTVGEDIVFGAGHYAPATAAGRKLLAHELTHTIQQGFQKRHFPVSVDVASPESREEQRRAIMTLKHWRACLKIRTLLTMGLFRDVYELS